MNDRFVNSLGSCALDTVSFLLIHSFTHQPIHFFMQNEPNLITYVPDDTNESRKRRQFYPKLLNIFIHLRWTFAHKSKKMRIFCKFLKTSYLTPCVSKAYINIPIRPHWHQLLCQQICCQHFCWQYNLQAATRQATKKYKTNPISDIRLFTSPQHTGHGSRPTSDD